MKSQQNTRWIYLSYPLDENTPAYGGMQGNFSVMSEKNMEQGDSCNTSRWTLSNHIGTHLDFPRHFVRTGSTIDEYPIDFFVFNKIGFIDISPVPKAHIISWQDIESENLPYDIDILLVKTGFGEKRNDSIYWKENPGFFPELAHNLRESFPQIRVLGFDLISLSSLMHREIGRKAHKCFLDHQRPILPLEDIDLSGVSGSFKFNQLIVAPWMVCKADAVPCTVIAEIFDEK